MNSRKLYQLEESTINFNEIEIDKRNNYCKNIVESNNIINNEYENDCNNTLKNTTFIIDFDLILKNTIENKFKIIFNTVKLKREEFCKIVFNVIKLKIKETIYNCKNTCNTFSMKIFYNYVLGKNWNKNNNTIFNEINKNIYVKNKKPREIKNKINKTKKILLKVIPLFRIVQNNI